MTDAETQIHHAKFDTYVEWLKGVLTDAELSAKLAMIDRAVYLSINTDVLFENIYAAQYE